MVHVIAVLTAVPGRREELMAAFRDNRPKVLAEPGCIQFAGATDLPDPAPAWAQFGPDALVVLEQWQDRAALKAHAMAPHTQAFAARVKDLLASRVVHVLAPDEN